ncbi:MAG: hypothetical protein ACRDRW_15745 [Pseudonocardiaceae bacterium]
MPTGASSPRQRRAGRHRRARLSWWRPQLGAIVEVTVAELVRRGECERAYASRARRVRVVARQRSTPDATATGPVTVGYLGSPCSTGEVHHG